VLTPQATNEEVARVVDYVHGKYQQMCQELSGTIVGMKDVTEQLMIGILCPLNQRHYALRAPLGQQKGRKFLASSLS
jgi:hypothetical protein